MVASGCERVEFDGPIGAYQGSQHPMAAAQAEVELARMITYRFVWAFDNQKDAGELFNMVSCAATAAAIHVCDATLQCV